MSSNQSRYEVLDGMRGIAAITVMIYHFTQFGPYPLFQHAPVAVDLFFMLSGFVIMHSYGKKLRNGMHGAEYAKRRLVRLYPMFLVGILAGIVAYLIANQLPPGLSSNTDMFSIAAMNALFIPYLDYTNAQEDYVIVFPSNAPLWSLFFEMFASFVFIGLCRLSDKQIGIFCITCLAGIICAIVFYIITDSGLGVVTHSGWASHLFWAGFARVLFGFTLRMFLYQNIDKIKAYSITALFERVPYKTVFIGVGLLVFLSIPMEVMGIYNLIGVVLIMPVFLVTGALTIFENDKILKVCKFLGWISYPLYCLHLPIGVIVEYVSESIFDVSYYSFLPQAFAISMSIVAAILVTKYYDEPVRALLSGKPPKTVKTAAP
jgi:peptidoglycan/LPS O-acetylase OafA/YrhL